MNFFTHLAEGPFFALLLAAALPGQAAPQDRIDELSAVNKYDEALAACAEAEKAAIKAKDVDGVLAIRERKTGLGALKKEYEKVKEVDARLSADAEDPEANAVMGRFYGLVRGEWERAMPLLRKGSNPFLKALAERELGASDTGERKAAIGDAWFAGSAETEIKGGLTGAAGTATVKADREFIARARHKMIERALWWWREAWPLLADVDREKIRPKALAAQANPAPGPDRKGWDGLGWSPVDTAFTVARSQAFARGGRASLMVTGNPKVVNGTLTCGAPVRLIAGKEYELSCWYLSSGTENRDLLTMACNDADGKLFQPCAWILPDTPFWSRASAKFTVPNGVGMLPVFLVVGSKKGKVWIDDVSLTCEGKELLQTGSFEK